MGCRPLGSLHMNACTCACDANAPVVLSMTCVSLARVSGFLTLYCSMSVPERGTRNFLESRPMSAEIGPDPVNIAAELAESGSKLADIGPKPVDVLSNSGHMCPNWGQLRPSPAGVGRNRPTLGRVRPRPSSAKSGQVRLGIGQIWPEFGRNRPKLASAKVGRWSRHKLRPRLAGARPKLARRLPTSARCRSMFGPEALTKLDVGPETAKLGAAFDQSWPDFGQMWTRGGTKFILERWLSTAALNGNGGGSRSWRQDASWPLSAPPLPTPIHRSSALAR